MGTYQENQEIKVVTTPLPKSALVGFGEAIMTRDDTTGKAKFVSDSNPVPTSSVGLSSVTTGQKTVTTAGTQVVLAASTSCSGVTIRALTANTGIIYVGDSSVDSTNGFQINATQEVFVKIDDINKVYIDSSVNGEGVSWIIS